jgi:Family of unknown function (DUF5755)
MPRRCPPGVMCLTPEFAILVISLTFGIYLLFKQQQPTTTVIKSVPPPVNVYSSTTTNTDSRYNQAPEPLRFWQSGPDLRGALIPPGAIPINISTRGLPQAFQQSGIIKSGDQILPLYGRQTAYRSDRYNYYTRTDSYNPVQLPVRYQRRDCMDDIGCDELLGGESVKIAGLGKEGHVEVYKYDGPKYIPGLV